MKKPSSKFIFQFIIISIFSVNIHINGMIELKQIDMIRKSLRLQRKSLKNSEACNGNDDIINTDQQLHKILKAIESAERNRGQDQNKSICNIIKHFCMSYQEKGRSKPLPSRTEIVNHVKAIWDITSEKLPSDKDFIVWYCTQKITKIVNTVLPKIQQGIFLENNMQQKCVAGQFTTGKRKNDYVNNGGELEIIKKIH